MKRTHPSHILSLVCLLLVVIVLSACNGSGRQAAAPTLAAQMAAEATQPAPVSSEPTPPGDLETLSAALAAEIVDDRPGVLATLGRPDAFDISVVAVEGGQVRLESWRYYQFGTRIDFVDGEVVWTMDIDPLPDGTFFAAWYDPLDFTTCMSAADASRVIAAASPAGAAPERIDLAAGGEELAGGSALVGDQIMIGLHEDRVIYVETVALLPQGGAP